MSDIAGTVTLNPWTERGEAFLLALKELDGFTIEGEQIHGDKNVNFIVRKA
jgi:hypothetical protein